MNRRCARVGGSIFPGSYDKENSRMKKYAAFAASVVIASVALVGCGEDKFCGQAEDIVGGTGEMPDKSAMQELADNAPDEISDDFQVLADAMNDPKSADQADLQQAQGNISSWGEDNCDS
jgi:hypothetical protein